MRFYQQKDSFCNDPLPRPHRPDSSLALWAVRLEGVPSARFAFLFEAWQLIGVLAPVGIYKECVHGHTHLLPPYPLCGHFQVTETRRLGSVTLGPSPLARPWSGSVTLGPSPLARPCNKPTSANTRQAVLAVVSSGIPPTPDRRPNPDFVGKRVSRSYNPHFPSSWNGIFLSKRSPSFYKGTHRRWGFFDRKLPFPASVRATGNGFWDPETLFSRKWGFGPLSGVGGIVDFPVVWRNL